MKTTTILVIAVLTSATTFAQVEFGLKGGLNLAKISVSATVPGYGSGSSSTDNLTSFHAGFYLTAPLGGMMSIQPELVYSGQGGTSGGSTLNLSYLNVPLMFLYNATPHMNIHAGPQLGFLLDASSGSTSLTDNFNSVDFGLCFGIGGKFDTGLTLGFRYNLGLTNNAKVDTTGAPSGTTITSTNQVMQFSVGFRFSK